MMEVFVIRPKGIILLLIVGIITILFYSCNNEKIEMDGYGFYIKETQNFKIRYTDADKENIRDIADHAEQGLKKIMKDFHANLMLKATITIYKDKDSLFKSFGMEISDSNNWIVGVTYTIDDIRLESISDCASHNYEEMLKVLVHELTHSVTLGMNPDLEEISWLREAIALYEAEQFRSPYGYELPTFKELRSPNSLNIYSCGYVLVEYINQKWGMNALVDLIKSSGNIEHSLKANEKDFEKGWHEYLKKNYLHQKS